VLPSLMLKPAQNRPPSQPRWAKPIDRATPPAARKTQKAPDVPSAIVSSTFAPGFTFVQELRGEEYLVREFLTAARENVKLQSTMRRNFELSSKSSDRDSSAWRQSFLMTRPSSAEPSGPGLFGGHIPPSAAIPPTVSMRILSMKQRPIHPGALFSILASWEHETNVKHIKVPTLRRMGGQLQSA
jgi:hypothetical protein